VSAGPGERGRPRPLSGAPPRPTCRNNPPAFGRKMINQPARARAGAPEGGRGPRDQKALPRQPREGGTAVPAVYDCGVETSPTRNPKIPCRACVVRPWSFVCHSTGPACHRKPHRPSAANFINQPARAREDPTRSRATVATALRCRAGNRPHNHPPRRSHHACNDKPAAVC
jgi:hypothetical protein